MAPIPDRIPLQQQTNEPKITREQSLREVELTIARGRVAAAKREEAKERERQAVNAPQPHPGRQPDVFDRAKADWNAQAEFEAAVMKQLDAELAAIERQARIRRKRFQIKMRALAALKGYRK
jgi:hypothetical protein